jgi:hypothetical protein
MASVNRYPTLSFGAVGVAADLFGRANDARRRLV